MDVAAPPRRHTRAPARALVRAMRPRQWIKNGLVFAVPAAAGQLLDGDVLADTLLAFLAFCLASAATYLLNDVADVEADRRHPLKRTRPIAAGEVSVRTATIAAVLCLLLSFGVALLSGIELLGIVAAYIVLTTAYSRALKHVAIFDIATVASGFFLRAVAGGVAADLFISKWFLILSGGGSLFVVTAKRYAELRSTPAEGRRRVLSEYSEEYLRGMLATTAGVIVIAYLIWSFNRTGVGWPAEASAVPFVLGIMRYGLLVDQGHGEKPEALLFADRTLLGLVFACLALLALGTVL
jgi:decaprenyl-phosphate phosphoribosyltransferase